MTLNESTACILIVDDDENARAITRYRLERQDYRVVEADSGLAALEKIKASTFDTVLMDNMMPGFSGMQTVEELRKTHSREELPVIMVTAVPESKTIVEAMECGANDYVIKPVDFPVLFARLETQLALKRAREETDRHRDDLERIIEERTAKLKSSERLLRTVFNNLPLPIYVKDLESRYLMANEELARIFDTSPDKLIGRTLKDIEGVCPEDAEKLIREEQRMMATGESIDQHEVTLARGKGESRIYHIRKVPLHDEQNRIVGLLGLSEDITERKAADEALRASEEKFRNLVEGSIQGLYIHRDFKFLFVNQALATILGYESPEALMREVPDLSAMMVEDYREILMDFYHRRIEGDLTVPSQYEGQWVRRDGEIIWLETSVRVIDWDGEPAVQSTFVDITDRKKAEEDLLHSRQLLQTVFDTVPHWLFIKDREARYLMVNSHMAEFFGLAPGEFLGKTYQEIGKNFSPLETQGIVYSDLEVIRRNEPVISHTEVPKPDGSVMKRRVIRLPITSGEGDATGLVGISEDITDQEQAEQALRQAQKMEAVGELTSGVAHDFNNILQIVSGYAQMAAADKNLDPRTSENLKKVLEATERATNLTRQLLTFSRKSALKARPLDLNAVIANMGKMIRIVLGVNIQFAHHPGEGLGVVMGDPGMIEQVLLNLCINARDVMPEGGGIDITTQTFEADEDFARTHAWERPGRYVQVSVSDNGTGMTQEVRDRIFEPFFTTKAPGKGTGLGLAMVYGIIQQHKGEIIVESEPGRGTTFHLYFPEMVSRVTETREMKTTSTKGGTETILVAEDASEVMGLVVDILEGEGYQVISVADGMEAIEAFNKNPDRIDLMVLDVLLPKVGGREVYERIRKIRPSMPVVFASGLGGDSADTRFLMDMEIKWVQKPFLANDLLRAVRSVLDKSLSA